VFGLRRCIHRAANSKHMDYQGRFSENREEKVAYLGHCEQQALCIVTKFDLSV
jgi:hypothetical protein